MSITCKSGLHTLTVQRMQQASYHLLFSLPTVRQAFKELSSSLIRDTHRLDRIFANDEVVYCEDTWWTEIISDAANLLLKFCRLLWSRASLQTKHNNPIIFILFIGYKNQEHSSQRGEKLPADKKKLVKEFLDSFIFKAELQKQLAS